MRHSSGDPIHTRYQAAQSFGSREYAIQVAAFRSAVALADQLDDVGVPAYVVDPQPGDAAQLYRVRFGDCADQTSAETAGARVTNDHALDWFVVALP
ncbi:MAG: SPOR domain-containing protein [Vicinamibacterales bacterium]|nr:SPOR domain-containing protein [Vicinamibacterales bacterium]